MVVYFITINPKYQYNFYNDINEISYKTNYVLYFLKFHLQVYKDDVDNILKSKRWYHGKLLVFYLDPYVLS